jgi:hypothetical protein
MPEMSDRRTCGADKSETPVQLRGGFAFMVCLRHAPTCVLGINPHRMGMPIEWSYSYTAGAFNAQILLSG